MIRTKIRNHREGHIRPAWPARRAATRFRRAWVEPILTRPPVRPIQACIPPEIGSFSPHEFTCVAKAESVRNKRQHWLVLTRP